MKGGSSSRTNAKDFDAEAIGKRPIIRRSRDRAIEQRVLVGVVLHHLDAHRVARQQHRAEELKAPIHMARAIVRQHAVPERLGGVGRGQRALALAERASEIWDCIASAGRLPRVV